MKQQGLAEPLKDESYEQSALRSELAKKEKYIEELKKETEVIICNYMYVYVHNYTVYICTCIQYIHIRTYLYSYFM